MLISQEKNAHDHAAPSRLLARLIRSLLARESFDTLADLTAALKDDCARLRIRWTPDDISAAYRLIDAARGLPGGRPMRPNPQHVERVDAVVPLSRAEAADLCRRLGVALEREQAQEPAPPPSRADAEATLARVYAGLARHERAHTEAS